jgi:protein-S-isoprenylcysteine O-methyltransferase Ste14
MTDDSSSDTSGVKILPPIVFLAGLIVGYAIWWFFAIPVAPAAWSLPVRIAGVVAVALGGWFMFSAAGRFARLGTNVSPFEPTTALATDGPYRYSRNPIYFGMALIQGGLALLGNALWPLLALVPVIWVIRTQVIDREERYLEAKFGGEYRDFKARVRRWI